MTPAFSSYDQALEWVEGKVREYGGRNRFLSSDEYKRALPEIRRLYDEWHSGYSARKGSELAAAGLQPGDLVEYTAVSPFGFADTFTGQIVMRKGVPWVKIDPPAPKKSQRWTPTWRKKGKSTMAKKNPSVSEESMFDELVLSAVNDGDAYRDNKNATRAVDNAMKDYRRNMAVDMEETFDLVRKKAIKEVASQWRRSNPCSAKSNPRAANPAKRYIGDAIVTIEYQDDDTYSGKIQAGGKTWKFDELRAPRAGLSFASDSPEAYDKMAQSAVSFASYYTTDNRGDETPTWAPSPATADAIAEAVGWAMDDRGDYDVRRKKNGSRPSKRERLKNALLAMPRAAAR